MRTPTFRDGRFLKKLKKVPKIKRPRRPDKIMKISEDSFRALRTILARPTRGPWDGTDRDFRGDESDEKILTWLKGVFYIGPEVVTLQADDSLNLLLLPCHLEQISTIPWVIFDPGIPRESTRDSVKCLIFIFI